MNTLQATEYAPYFQKYTSLVPHEAVAPLLAANGIEVTSFFRSIPEALHSYRYAPGKWTIKDVLQHITDTERVMAFRALAAARGDGASSLSLMDENLYAAGADTSHVSLAQLIAEFEAVRSSTVLLYTPLSNDKLLQTSYVNGQNTTARAWGYIMAGHGLHHVNVIRERYM